MQKIPNSDKDIKNIVYWFVAVVVIVLLSVFGRNAQLFIISKMDSRFIAGIVFVILFGILFALWRKRGRYHIQKRTFLVTMVLLLCAIAAVQLRYLMPAEAVHLLVFSWLGWLSVTVFGPFSGVAVVVLVAGGDEILQHYLPDRIGDLRDVVINLLSGFIGIVLKCRS